VHKSLEKILIVSAVVAVLLYALISFWPGGQQARIEPSPSNVALRPLPKDEAPVEPNKSEDSVIANLVRIGSAELSFRQTQKRFGGFGELIREKLLSQAYSEGAIIDGYRYMVEAGVQNFCVFADPAPGEGRHYFIDETLDLRYDDNGRASSSSLYLSYAKNEERDSTGSLPNPPTQ
jgi:hypothetical protein